MLVEMARDTEVFGSVKIHELQRVLKFDSGDFENPRVCNVPFESIRDVLKRMAIIIPVKNENMHLLDGVLRAIPFHCSVILVSNSDRDTHDVYKIETDAVTNIHELTQQEILCIHQKDPALGDAFHKAGYDSILDKKGLVRDGKSEGMIAGMMLAKSIGKDFMGFIDADNYIPGSVREYILDFAGGLCMSKSPYSMVRLHWKYKPKVVEDKFYFKKWGRVSETTNKFLNLLLSEHTGFETGVIVTGNSGEHALTTKLADIMTYSSGYSVEPYHYVYLFENFGPDAENTVNPDAVTAGVEVFQIETLNPHLHEEKGRAHIRKMLAGSLSTVYYSKLSNDGIREKIVEEIKDLQKSCRKPKENARMPPIGGIDVGKFMKGLQKDSKTYLRLKQGEIGGEAKHEKSSLH